MNNKIYISFSKMRNGIKDSKIVHFVQMCKKKLINSLAVRKFYRTFVAGINMQTSEMQAEVQSVSIRSIKQLKSLANTNKFLKKVGVPAPYTQAREDLLRVLNTLQKNLIVVIEYDYVDLMYRNEYYNFYATKKYDYNRNCAKLSFFRPGSLKEGKDVEYNKSNIESIKKDYLGFLVVRPIAKCVGRNAISIEAKKKKYRGITICETEMQSSALGMSVSVKAYPHSSQDSEMMKCAETALWSVLEYFGYKCSNHRTALPSEILQSIAVLAHQRQTPSRGLMLNQMSATLKNFGLNPLVFDAKIDVTYFSNREEYEKKMMISKWSFQTYVESGIPILLFLTGPLGHSGDAHATVCIGREKEIQTDVFFLGSDVWRKSVVKNIVICDDNVPYCQVATFDEPTIYYENWKKGKHKIGDWSKFKDMSIHHFIVPLPTRVYMNAYTASELIFDLKKKNFIEDDKITRTILVSSRSLRDHIATSECMPNDMKIFLLQLKLPHYVWFTELFTDKEKEERKVSGMVIIDATDTFLQTPNLIFCFTKNKKYYYDFREKRLEECSLEDNDFVLERYDKCIN